MQNINKKVYLGNSNYYKKNKAPNSALSIPPSPMTATLGSVAVPKVTMTGTLGSVSVPKVTIKVKKE